ncbi:MAG: hypothetical protein JO116_06610, partial [Planctomycetaceae bacterium]|nr:hypothetical protein [Planctomycetaceae bacterium]
ALPTTYTVADVCRPELLVEIEGIALSRRRTDRPRGAGGPHFRLRHCPMKSTLV